MPPGELVELHKGIECAGCHGLTITQVDWVEVEYPVVRAPIRGPTVLTMEAHVVDVGAIHRSLFRCKRCGIEWDVPAGTSFIDISQAGEPAPPN